MKTSMQLLKNLAREESGQDLIEYALVAALIGLGAVASLRFLSNYIQYAFINIATQLPRPPNPNLPLRHPIPCPSPPDSARGDGVTVQPPRSKSQPARAAPMAKLHFFPLSVPAAMHLASLVLALLSTVTDLRTRRIPNALSGTAFVLALLLAFAAGGWPAALRSVAAALLCGFVFLLFYLAGGMGAGDVKLVAAQGALLGLENVMPLLTFTAIAGGALALIVAFYRGQVRQSLANTALLLSHHAQSGLTPHAELNVRNASTLRLPYAFAIAAGAVLTLAAARGASW